nr:ABC transporter G family member 14-like [Ipomoea batatas]
MPALHSVAPKPENCSPPSMDSATTNQPADAAPDDKPCLAYPLQTNTQSFLQRALYPIALKEVVYKVGGEDKGSWLHGEIEHEGEDDSEWSDRHGVSSERNASLHSPAEAAPEPNPGGESAACGECDHRAGIEQMQKQHDRRATF